MEVQEVALRLLIAAALGSLIGLDRERHDRAAGLRTHALVATASALIMIVSAYGFTEAVDAGRIVLDPSRVAAQIVSGIGFLGAGVIIFRQNIVRGLTTAASVWSVAGIGMAVGGGLYAAAIVATIIFLIILVALKEVEHRLFISKRVMQVTIRTDVEQSLMPQIEQAATDIGLEVQQVAVNWESGKESVINMRIRGSNRLILADFVEHIKSLTGVHQVAYSSPEKRRDDVENDNDSAEEWS